MDDFNDGPRSTGGAAMTARELADDLRELVAWMRRQHQWASFVWCEEYVVAEVIQHVAGRTLRHQELVPIRGRSECDLIVAQSYALLRAAAVVDRMAQPRHKGNKHADD